MRLIFITAIILLFQFPALSQKSIKNYIHDSNKIAFTYHFNTVPYKVNNLKDSKEIDFINYSDEGKPGQYSLPAKELFIALPSFSKAKIKLIPLKTKNIQGIPKRNPRVISESDTSVAYDYFTSSEYSNKSSIKPLYVVKGYLWIKNYYCVHITVYQYRFNNSNILEELNDVKFQILI